ncbi:hypothetical protein BH766_gp89 [Gordonia phage Demosthenes]|uniref:Uncharacterized protein n=1 Tax=Gordonia phage Demosthenes TaxID=1838067 RepID=A0A160DE37_9CAUD|nr:hypothetical protein BH766_gp89 [Gordonia phage Demosthenes]ANA86058.1 hypothetical protein PBI_DEMOSTHENES_89 [Gordonia phage Demosthenes]
MAHMEVLKVGDLNQWTPWHTQVYDEYLGRVGEHNFGEDPNEVDVATFAAVLHPWYGIGAVVTEVNMASDQLTVVITRSVFIADQPYYADAARYLYVDATPLRTEILR